MIKFFKVKVVLSFLLILGTNLCVYSQISFEEIKDLTSKLDYNIKNTSKSETGVKGIKVSHIGRTIIFHYEVPDGWFQLEKKYFLRNLIHSGKYLELKKSQINYSYYYYKKDVVVQVVDVSWTDFDDFYLGDYIELSKIKQSKGLNIKVKEPLGWKVNRGEINLVMFSDDDKLFSINIGKQDTTFSLEEINDIFKSQTEVDYLKDDLVNSLNGSYDISKINYEVIKINNHPYLLISGHSSKLKKKIYLWTTFFNDYLISFSGFCNDDKSQVSFIEFHLISKSIRFN